MDVWFLGGLHKVSSFSLVSAFSLFYTSRSFSLSFNLTHYITAITIRRSSTVTVKRPANSMGYFCCEPFGGSKASVLLVSSMTQLTAALMRCDKLSKL